jgi:hypothetical protein
MLYIAELLAIIALSTSPFESKIFYKKLFCRKRLEYKVFTRWIYIFAGHLPYLRGYARAWRGRSLIKTEQLTLCSPVVVGFCPLLLNCGYSIHRKMLKLWYVGSAQGALPLKLIYITDNKS